MLKVILAFLLAMIYIDSFNPKCTIKMSISLFLCMPLYSKMLNYLIDLVSQVIENQG